MAEHAAKRKPLVVTPGDLIATEEGFMRGHGTIMIGEQLASAIGGVVERVNKVVCVKALRSRYTGEIGDVVVGRIVEVGQKRWKVDTNSRLDSLLKLSSVNLPGGILRRKSTEDELMMREFFEEGDLISAEVQAIFQEDNTLSLHTRNQKYGKLGPGVFVSVPSMFIRRCKNHFHVLPCGVAVVLGTNGYIWIGQAFDSDLKDVRPELRERISRVRNVILALAHQGLAIFDTSIIYTYEDAESMPVKDLLRPDVAADITARARVLCA
eukprot:m.21321 g.21321  ORF g.21321 m.21321 type:complete len:267 (-) comp8058_c0_seq1:29-829(-)